MPSFFGIRSLGAQGRELKPFPHKSFIKCKNQSRIFFLPQMQRLSVQINVSTVLSVHQRPTLLIKMEILGYTISGLHNIWTLRYLGYTISDTISVLSTILVNLPPAHSAMITFALLAKYGLLMPRSVSPILHP